MDAALELTPAQHKSFAELRETIRQLTKTHREELEKAVRDSGAAKSE